MVGLVLFCLMMNSDPSLCSNINNKHSVLSFGFSPVLPDDRFRPTGPVYLVFSSPHLSTLYWHCIAYSYDWRGFVGTKRKISVGLLLLNSLMIQTLTSAPM
jgi:hypothetical protein